MSRVWLRSFVVLLLVTAMLSLVSCEYFLPPNQDHGTPTLPEESSSEPNAEPLDPTEDPFPLFLGAHWAYRDATPDVNPELHPGPRIETDVVGIVRRVDTAAGEPYDCYVLRTRRSGAPEVLSYVHRTATSVDLYGVEVMPYTGAPELIEVDGRQYMPLPLQKGLEWGFFDPYGVALDANVIGWEFVPLGDTVFALIGPYTSSSGGAWRVKWEFGGALDDAYGPGIVETWLAPGVGMVRRSAESRYSELVEFRPSNQVKVCGIDDFEKTSQHIYNGGHYDLPAKSVVAFQFRGADATASSGWRWEVEQSCWNALTAAGVLSPLWDGDWNGEFFRDIEGVKKLASGSYTFLFEVRTEGTAELRFKRSGVGTAQGASDEFVCSFGANQPASLTNGSVSTVTTGAGASATFRVHYKDDDGTPLKWRQVIFYKRGDIPDETLDDNMKHKSGKWADGVYESTSQVTLSLNTDYLFYFRFVTDDKAPAKSEVYSVYIGGPIP